MMLALLLLAPTVAIQDAAWPSADRSPPTATAAAGTPAVFAPAVPRPGNGSYLGLGMKRAMYDVQTPTGDDGHLGVAATGESTETNGFFYVSARGVPIANPAVNAKIYKFDHTGVLVNTFPQSINLSSAWGDRDLATDDARGALYGGSENGWFTEYALDGAGDITGSTAFTIPGVGTVRALARDQSGASQGRIFWTASFNGAIFCFDLDGGGPGVVTVLGSFGNPGKAFYGFADDPTDTDKVWGHSQDSANSTLDLVEWNEMSQSTGFGLTGVMFDGEYIMTTNLAGGADTYCDTILSNIGTFDFVSVHQQPVDMLYVYQTDLQKGTSASTYCTPKSGLVCGTPAISASGSSSASSTSGFVVSAAPARNNKSGILLYNVAAMAGVPFQGGILCVETMGLRRAGSTNSGAGCAPSNCSGVFAVDMNAFTQSSWFVPDCNGVPSGIPASNPAGFLSSPGTAVFCAFWGRDSLATGSFVSDALTWTVGP